MLGWLATEPAATVTPFDTNRPPVPLARSRRWWPLPVLAAIVVVVVVVVVLGYRGARGYYALSPGTAPQLTTSASCRAHHGQLEFPDGRACARISVPASKDHGIGGHLFMVDVEVGPATPVQYLLQKAGLLGTFDHGAQIVPSSEILGTAPANQLGCQDTEEMAGATQSAAATALSRLGYQVSLVETGAQIFQVQPNTPAERAGVECQDVVTAVDGHPVRSAVQLGKVINQYRPGDRVAMSVERDGKKLTLHAKLTTPPASLVRSAPAGDKPKAYLGVASETKAHLKLPFRVTINAGDIGGPSAGLAFTLGVLDALTHGHLTGGHAVAATGTISPDGAVGEVGGVAQKAVAVRRAGAQVFFVPKAEYAAARSTAGDMRVVPVTTLNQVLADLKALGGNTSGVRRRAKALRVVTSAFPRAAVSPGAND